MEEALEIPIINDLTMVLGSISQVLNNEVEYLVCAKRGFLLVMLWVLGIVEHRSIKTVKERE